MAFALEAGLFSAAMILVYWGSVLALSIVGGFLYMCWKAAVIAFKTITWRR